MSQAGWLVGGFLLCAALVAASSAIVVRTAGVGEGAEIQRAIKLNSKLTHAYVIRNHHEIMKACGPAKVAKAP